MLNNNSVFNDRGNNSIHTLIYTITLYILNIIYNIKLYIF